MIIDLVNKLFQSLESATATNPALCLSVHIGKIFFNSIVFAKKEYVEKISNIQLAPSDLIVTIPSVDDMVEFLVNNGLTSHYVSTIGGELDVLLGDTIVPDDELRNKLIRMYVPLFILLVQKRPVLMALYEDQIRNRDFDTIIDTFDANNIYKDVIGQYQPADDHVTLYQTIKEIVFNACKDTFNKAKDDDVVKAKAMSILDDIIKQFKLESKINET